MRQEADPNEARERHADLRDRLSEHRMQPPPHQPSGEALAFKDRMRIKQEALAAARRGDGGEHDGALEARRPSLADVRQRTTSRQVDDDL